MTDLEKAQAEYIKFLGEEIGKLESFCIGRPWKTPQETIEKGVELRAKIESLK